MRCSRLLLILLLVSLAMAESVSANAFVRGAYYRLGDDDPGAAPGATGIDPTRDSFSDALHLSRFRSPRYSADVPSLGPSANKLSMAFSQIGPGGNPVHFGHYGRGESLPMVEQGYALEAWVKTEIFFIVPPSGPGQLVAYNGYPTANGFGFYRSGNDYVARSAGFTRKLGTVTDTNWHHLAYVQTLGTSSYFFDGALVAESNQDPIPTAATGGFWLAGRTAPTGDVDLFNGFIDEVRYQSFNPMAAGSFNPTSFLIGVPEPTAISSGLIAALALARRRKVARSPRA
jgi:Concanavalin A-like lectin/glucanases superfamily